MSRVGRKLIRLPKGVSVAINGADVGVSGPLGKLNWSVPSAISVAFDDDKEFVKVTRQGDRKQTRALHGLSRALIANMVEGVSKGFERRLLIYGTGYGCKVSEGKLELNLGFMGRGAKNVPQFRMDIPEGLEVTVEVPVSRGDRDPAKLSVKGCDKQQVGQFVSAVRKLRPPEPYKGKGVRYEGEYVRRKQGKAVVGSGG